MLPANIKKERHTANMVAVFVFLLLWACMFFMTRGRIFLSGQ